MSLDGLFEPIIMNGEGGMDKRVDERKSPCVLQDFVPFGAAAQKKRKEKKIKNSRKSARWSAVPVPCLSRLCLKL